MVCVRAQVGPPNYGDPNDKFTVQYFDEHGNMVIRSGSSRAWRCNNPGNLIASAYSRGKNRRSIGKAGDGKNEYAVYPDYETGHEALVVMLKGSIYSPLTLRAAIRRYDSTNPNYMDAVTVITGLDPERKLNSLSNDEFDSFWKAIERIEKWESGREDFIECWIISGVRKKRGTIVEYCIAEHGREFWVTKIRALELAGEGRLHAIIVHMKNGTTYLRAKPGSHPFKKVA